jgi:hypothetical protein
LKSVLERYRVMPRVIVMMRSPTSSKASLSKCQHGVSFDRKDTRPGDEKAAVESLH